MCGGMAAVGTLITGGVGMPAVGSPEMNLDGTGGGFWMGAGLSTGCVCWNWVRLRCCAISRSVIRGGGDFLALGTSCWSFGVAIRSFGGSGAALISVVGGCVGGGFMVCVVGWSFGWEGADLTGVSMIV